MIELPTIRLAGRAERIYRVVSAGKPVRQRDLRVLARRLDELAAQLETFAGLPAMARPAHYDIWYSQAVMYLAEVMANLQRAVDRQALSAAI